MRRYTESVADRTDGHAVQNAQVTVWNPDSTAAVVYADAAGTILKAQPILTDIYGEYWFYAPDGRYDIRHVYGVDTHWVYDVPIYDINPYGFDVMSERFGAVGDGVTNDSAAVQAACTAAAVLGGKVIFPEGFTFLLEDTIALGANTTLTGGGTILSGITGATQATGFVFYGASVDNIVADGLIINGASVAVAFNATGYPGIFGLYNCDNVSIRNCHIYDSGADAVLLSATAPNTSTDIQITNNVIENCRRDGIVVGSNVIGVTICDNQVLETFGSGIDVEPALGNSGDIIIRSNRIHCTRTTDFDATTWPRSLDVSCVGPATIGRVIVNDNYFSYVMPDAYLATAAASGNRCCQVWFDNIVGPVTFVGNTIYTNQMSDSEDAYGLLTFRTLTNGLTCSGNTVFRPETAPTHADNEGHAVWVGYIVYGTDNVQISGDRIKGSFNIPFWLNTCDNVTADIHVENTAESVDANVESVVSIYTCTNVKLTGYFSGPDRTIITSAVDGLLVHDAYLRSSAAGDHLRNITAVSDHVAFLCCMTDQNDAVAFPNTALTQSNDGNVITNFFEGFTVDLTV